jgi:hypothetical protein
MCAVLAKAFGIVFRSTLLKHGIYIVITNIATIAYTIVFHTATHYESCG